MSERWLPVPGFEGYEVSDIGRVRSHRLDPAGRLLKQSLGSSGYLSVNLGRGNSWNLHRLVMLAFVGPLPKGMETRHLDGNKLRNTLSNLAYGTVSENARDAVAHGQHPMASKRTCPRGHEYDYTDPNGGRRCRACRRISQAAYRQRRAA